MFITLHSISEHENMVFKKWERVQGLIAYDLTGQVSKLIGLMSSGQALIEVVE